MRHVRQWFFEQRSSVRLSFMLQIGCRIAFSVLSLVWTPLLVSSMGKALNGAFLSFQSLASLAGLGDLGMGGMVNIQTSRMLGKGDDSALKRFLAVARAFFLVAAVLAFGVLMVISPNVFRVWSFDTIPGVGSFFPLALVAALAVALLVLNSYINNLNYGCGNVVWLIVPAFLSMQLSILGHWLLARADAPLWLQYVPYIVGAFIVQALGWYCIRISHPQLASASLAFDRRQFLSLFGNSFWVYLSNVANSIYVAADRFLITAGFGAALVPVYSYNTRLCELALFMVNSGNSASMPKITQWLASPDSELRARAIHEVFRINRFQTFLSCTAALGYLAINDWFMALWLGRDFQAPFAWQLAFAASLGIAGAGLMGLELASRCCDQGIKIAGITVFCASLVKLSLSWLSMNQGHIVGLAVSSVIASSLAMLGLGLFTSRQLCISWWRLTVKNWLLALVVVVLGAVVHHYQPAHSFEATTVKALLAVGLTPAIGWAVGVRLADLRAEFAVITNMFRAIRKN